MNNNQKNAAQGQNCQAWEHQIDTLVARLYGLENDEIAIVKV